MFFRQLHKIRRFVKIIDILLIKGQVRACPGVKKIKKVSKILPLTFLYPIVKMRRKLKKGPSPYGGGVFGVRGLRELHSNGAIRLHQ